MYVTDIAEAVLEYATEHYEEGWDVIVEMGEQPLADYLWEGRKTPRTVAGGIAKASLLVEARAARDEEYAPELAERQSSQDMLAEAEADAKAEEAKQVEVTVEAKPAPRPRAPRRSRKAA